MEVVNCYHEVFLVCYEFFSGSVCPPVMVLLRVSCPLSVLNQGMMLQPMRKLWDRDRLWNMYMVENA